MMEEHSVNLLRECDSGCKMAAESLGQIRDILFLLAVDSTGQLKGSIATERLTFLKKTPCNPLVLCTLALSRFVTLHCRSNSRIYEQE